MKEYITNTEHNTASLYVTAEADRQLPECVSEFKRARLELVAGVASQLGLYSTRKCWMGCRILELTVYGSVESSHALVSGLALYGARDFCLTVENERWLETLIRSLPGRCASVRVKSEENARIKAEPDTEGEAA